MTIGACYIHVPFCASKCLYCDFDSQACKDATMFDVYVRSMCSRLDALGRAGVLRSCQTVYIGGGTPSVLGMRLPDLVRSVRAACPCCKELTCEANPESFSSELAAALRAAGATRISFGVQSFVDRELMALGRIHCADRARDALGLARREGFVTSLDLMCGIPLQTQASWDYSLECALACAPDHISIYPLTLEPETPLARAAARDESLEPDEDFQADCMLRGRAALMQGGYAPYEVASYARAGRVCAHNIAYWTGVPYLGLGRSAASMLDRASYDALARVVDLPALSLGDAVRLRFVEGEDGAPSVPSIEQLNVREALAEDLMLSMRMVQGASAELIERARAKIGDALLDRACDAAVSLGLAQWQGSATGPRLMPTERGWLMGNELFELMWDVAYD